MHWAIQKQEEEATFQEHISILELKPSLVKSGQRIKSRHIPEATLNMPVCIYVSYRRSLATNAATIAILKLDKNGASMKHMEERSYNVLNAFTTFGETHY